MLRKALLGVVLGVIISGISLSAILVSAEQNYNIPSWVKNNAKWWGESQISDADFIQGIQYLIEQNILETGTSNEVQEEIDLLKFELSNLRLKYDDLQVEYNDLWIERNKLKNQLSDAEFVITAGGQLQDTMTKAYLDELARTNPLVRGMIDGQLKFYIEPVPYYASSDVEDAIRDLANGFETETALSEMRFKRVYNENDADISISWIKNYGTHTVGESIFKSVIKVGLGADNCYGDWQAFDTLTVMTIFAHELGHSLGYGHSNDPNNIMYYSTDPKFETDYDKTITIDEGEILTLQFCNEGTMYYKISSDDQYNGVYVLVIPPESVPSDVVNGDGLYYPDCSSQDFMISFSNECTVPLGAKLVLYNSDDLTNFSAIRVDVQIIDFYQPKNIDYGWDQRAFEYDEEWLDLVWDMYHN